MSTSTTIDDGTAGATKNPVGTRPTTGQVSPRWDSLRAPLRYKRRNPAEQAAEALLAHAARKHCRPTDLSDARYRTYLEVLGARVSNTPASLAHLAATMSPPMTKEAFAGQLRRAHAAAGVSITRAEREA